MIYAILQLFKLTCLVQCVHVVSIILMSCQILLPLHDIHFPLDNSKWSFWEVINVLTHIAPFKKSTRNTSRIKNTSSPLRKLQAQFSCSPFHPFDLWLSGILVGCFLLPLIYIKPRRGLHSTLPHQQFGSDPVQFRAGALFCQRHPLSLPSTWFLFWIWPVSGEIPGHNRSRS